MAPEIPKFDRRVSDSRANDIEDMIADENDPDKRVFLIVLNSINNSLNSSVRTIERIDGALSELSGRFEKHEATDIALLNQGKGMWKVIGFVLTLAQVMGFYVWTEVRKDMAQQQSEIHTLQMQQIRIAEKLALAEDKK